MLPPARRPTVEAALEAHTRAAAPELLERARELEADPALPPNGRHLPKVAVRLGERG